MLSISKFIHTYLQGRQPVGPFRSLPERPWLTANSTTQPTYNAAAAATTTTTTTWSGSQCYAAINHRWFSYPKHIHKTASILRLLYANTS